MNDWLPGLILLFFFCILPVGAGLIVVLAVRGVRRRSMRGFQPAKERDARQTLEAQLLPGETLVAYTSGKIAGLVRGQPYHFGLTENRLILLPLKQGQSSGQALSVQREKIKSLKLKWASFSADRMQVKLPSDTLTVNISGYNWRERTQEFARAVEQSSQPVSLGIAAARQSLIRQAQDFQELGFLMSAQHTLNEALQTDPALSMDPSVGQLQKQLTETRLAYRVGAGFLFAYIGVIALFSVFYILAGEGLAGFIDFYTIVSIFLALYFGVALWQGKNEQREPTIGAVILGFLYTIINVFMAGNFIGLITGLSFSGSITLVLTGKSNRRRTWLAIAIYVFGYLGVLALLMLISIAMALFKAI